MFEYLNLLWDRSEIEVLKMLMENLNMKADLLADLTHYVAIGLHVLHTPPVWFLSIPY